MPADRRRSDPVPASTPETSSRGGTLRLGFAATGAGVLAVSLFLLWNGSWTWSGPASLGLLIVGVALMAGAVVVPSVKPASGVPVAPALSAAGSRGKSGVAWTPTSSLAEDERAGYAEGSELETPSELPEHWSTSWMAAASSPEVADVLWQSWSTTPGELPVGLVAPVPETAYVAPKPDAPLLHEEGEPVALETLVANEPAYWASRRSGDIQRLPSAAPEPAAAAPPVITPTVTVTPGEAPVTSAPAPGPAGATGVAAEACQPMPPHLRAVSLSTDTVHAHQSSRPPTTPSVRCASCRKWIHDPKFWSRCGDCHSHLCTHCVVESLLAYEWAWCTHCAGLRHMNTLVHEVGPAQPRPRLASHRKPHHALSVADGGIHRARWQPKIGVPAGGIAGLPA